MYVSASTDVLHVIRAASALTEDKFLRAATALEASIEILGDLTASFVAVAADLKGDTLEQALQALSETADQVNQLGEDQSRETTAFDQLHCLVETIKQRIAQMNASLKGIDCLAVNAKIAAANINVPGTDVATFANQIGHTLDVVKQTLDSFTLELHVVGEQILTAHAGQIAFKASQQSDATSIMQRLAETIRSISAQHERAARSTREVKLTTERVHQRVRDAIVALQIGDITRQRLEHAESALALATAQSELDDEEHRKFVAAVQHLQSAQLSDAAENLDRELRQITGSLNSLAAEARTLRRLADTTYGASDRADRSFIVELEVQVDEARTLFERFERAQADAAQVTATVLEATASLRRHLQRVQSLEADIRIMGLNTTFKCARIGREGRALSVIAQELRNYANGFEREANALEGEVKNIVAITGALASGANAQQARSTNCGALAMRESHAMLREMGERLDLVVAGLETNGERVVTLLGSAVTDLEARNEIGQLIRDAAGELATQPPHDAVDFSDLKPHVEQMIDVMARGYTMAVERAVHDRILGRASVVATVDAVPTAELADFLF